MGATREKIAFTASGADTAQRGVAALKARYGDCPMDQADVIVALGGDGFMLQTLHATQEYSAPVYGMNRGTVGFLMNAYQEDDLPARVANAEEAVINPLRMRACSSRSRWRSRCVAAGRRVERPFGWGIGLCSSASATVVGISRACARGRCTEASSHAVAATLFSGKASACTCAA